MVCPLTSLCSNGKRQLHNFGGAEGVFAGAAVLGYLCFDPWTASVMLSFIEVIFLWSLLCLLGGCEIFSVSLLYC